MAPISQGPAGAACLLDGWAPRTKKTLGSTRRRARGRPETRPRTASRWSSRRTGGLGRRTGPRTCSGRPRRPTSGTRGRPPAAAARPPCPKGRARARSSGIGAPRAAACFGCRRSSAGRPSPELRSRRRGPTQQKGRLLRSRRERAPPSSQKLRAARRRDRLHGRTRCDACLVERAGTRPVVEPSRRGERRVPDRLCWRRRELLGHLLSMRRSRLRATAAECTEADGVA
mmetsp:Transcript_21097/g.68005  ORF Transcript_21097/g.68005 Transcript_21097/m.68005 type:complete len:229 (-) Transcript_21097:822-1508(-)